MINRRWIVTKPEAISIDLLCRDFGEFQNQAAAVFALLRESEDLDETWAGARKGLIDSMIGVSSVLKEAIDTLADGLQEEEEVALHPSISQFDGKPIPREEENES